MVPVLPAGQLTGVHVEMKNGVEVVASTVPALPAGHAQPAGTFVPVVPEGQLTGVHELVKNGDDDVAVTEPL